MTLLDPVETLRRVAFFAVLPADELRVLACHCAARRLGKDEMLVAEGDPCDGLFVVQSGAIKIFKMAENGREQVLVIERAGSTVGELSIFDGGNFPASAAAVEDSTLLFLPKKEFLDCAAAIRKWPSPLSAPWRGGFGTLRIWSRNYRSKRSATGWRGSCVTAR